MNNLEDNYFLWEHGNCYIVWKVSKCGAEFRCEIVLSSLRDQIGEVYSEIDIDFFYKEDIEITLEDLNEYKALKL